MVNSQEWLDRKYPIKEREKKIKELNINKKKLEGEINLLGFINLKKLDCSENKLAFLNIGDCSNLTEINCSQNLLTGITLPNNLTNLKMLNLSNNDFSATKDLTFLEKATSLEKSLKNNKFTGSLDYLSEMKQLKELNIV